MNMMDAASGHIGMSRRRGRTRPRGCAASTRPPASKPAIDTALGFAPRRLRLVRFRSRTLVSAVYRVFAHHPRPSNDRLVLDPVWPASSTRATDGGEVPDSATGQTLKSSDHPQAPAQVIAHPRLEKFRVGDK